ncbi:hypothetical protein GQX74_005834 [Glossina fuscipes]|nr:hypothetical protein GQX74_005834 [Glossina fuscipes]
MQSNNLVIVWPISDEITCLSTGRILYCGVVSSELVSLEYWIQSGRQGLVYRLRSVGWIEASVHTRLDPPIATISSPTAIVQQYYCSTGHTAHRLTLVLLIPFLVSLVGCRILALIRPAFW